MSARVCAATVLSVMLLIPLLGCDDRGESGSVTHMEPATSASEVVPPADSPETGTENQLNPAYLVGTWCSREIDGPQSSGTTYIFAEDGSYRWGKGAALADGAGAETLIASADVVSVEADSFVVSQLGTQLRFVRGECAE